MKDSVLAKRLKTGIRAIPDFPKEGILFRDITPLLQDPRLFRAAVRGFAGLAEGRIDHIVSIESRGFILGAALAYALGAGFIPVRKEGKLPHKKLSMSYELEYNTSVVEIHADAVRKGEKVVIVDDVLATGGTARAAVDLLGRLGADIVGIWFLIELDGLKGRRRLAGHPVRSLVTFA
ncbi:MAG TPA: adenine phosphoribosyltransferase [Candidatus Eisenbacteria bacterium]|nr:adenine phosphoribosyltransferase [Candidatus Eisenbacteria bacterium]